MNARINYSLNNLNSSKRCNFGEVMFLKPVHILTPFWSNYTKGWIIKSNKKNYLAKLEGVVTNGIEATEDWSTLIKDFSDRSYARQIGLGLYFGINWLFELTRITFISPSIKSKALISLFSFAQCYWWRNPSLRHQILFLQFTVQII